MIDQILGIVGKFVPDTNKAKELEAQIATEYTKSIEKIKMQQAEIIKAEQKVGGITANWRPYLMVMCMCIIFIHFLLTNVVPYIIVVSGSDIYYPILEDLSPNLWSFLEVGIGGYIGARSLEKIAEVTIKNWKK